MKQIGAPRFVLVTVADSPCVLDLDSLQVAPFAPGSDLTATLKRCNEHTVDFFKFTRWQLTITHEVTAV